MLYIATKRGGVLFIVRKRANVISFFNDEKKLFIAYEACKWQVNMIYIIYIKKDNFSILMKSEKHP